MEWGTAQPSRGEPMTTFEDRKRSEESKYKHDEELRFKIRNRRNRLFGQWIAETYLGMSGDAATAYAKDVVLADFEAPGDDDMMGKVKADLAAASQEVSDHLLKKHLDEFGEIAKQQVMAE
jgi:hypothetical protein